MQINIGILEDETSFIEELSSHIRLWEAQNFCQIHIATFHSCKEILDFSEIKFDLIFLDIQLPDGNGLDVAKTLRENGYSGELIFLTSYQEYVFDGYHVRAMNYLLKPTQYNAIKTCLDTILSIVNDENYIYRYRDTIIKIPYHDILYFNSDNHKTQIITASTIYTQAEPLRNILKYLPGQFVQCHRTAIINVQHILQIEGKNVTLSNKKIIPISNTYLEDVRTAFVAQIHKMR